MYTRSEMYFKVLFSHFKHFSFSLVTSFILAGVIYTMPQIKPFNRCITVGVGVHSCHFTKIRHFPLATLKSSRGLERVVNLIQFIN